MVPVSAELVDGVNHVRPPDARSGAYIGLLIAPFHFGSKKKAAKRQKLGDGALLALRAEATTRKQICLKGQKEKVLSLLPSQGGHFPPPRALHSCTTWARGYDDREWPQ